MPLPLVRDPFRKKPSGVSPAGNFLSLISLALSLAFLCGGGVHPLSAQGNPPVSGGLTVVSVDMALAITFHPAMRNFDHRSGKFVSQVPYNPPRGGLKALNQCQDERKALADLETEMNAQVGKVNAELASMAREAASADPPKAVSGPGPEALKYRRMGEEHRRALNELALKVLGGFPESLLGDLPADQLKRIMAEIDVAIEAEAKAQGAAFVLNLPTAEYSGGMEADNPNPLPDSPKDLIDKWNIQNLNDLENLAKLGTDSSVLPFGRPVPRKDPSKFCGGHFESVKDPEQLKYLIGEYFENRNLFCRPFENLGARKRILRGSLDFEEKDITLGVINRIFDLYKTRKAERDVVAQILRQRRGIQ